VKNLARELNTRIEMRQIGVRDKARLVGGVGGCGRELCCKSFLLEFEPVSVRMAKDQNLPLNPSKISGVCGRLMCCLTYEYKTYKQLSKEMPKCGKKVETCEGSGKVTRQNLLKGTVVVEMEDGKEVTLDSKAIKPRTK
jgi:cell fate regulator YaaT (PSP1 superfamily)